jgi:hypothetical protein
MSQLEAWLEERHQRKGWNCINSHDALDHWCMEAQVEWLPFLGLSSLHLAPHGKLRLHMPVYVHGRYPMHILSNASDSACSDSAYQKFLHSTAELSVALTSSADLGTVWQLSCLKVLHWCSKCMRKDITASFTCRRHKFLTCSVSSHSQNMSRDPAKE